MQSHDHAVLSVTATRGQMQHRTQASMILQKKKEVHISLLSCLVGMGKLGVSGLSFTWSV